VATTGDGGYEAEIRWTTHGVAHVRAADWGGLGFGQGYACARDNLPTLADQIVKVRSERARYFGPGPADANVASDFGYLALGVTDRAATLRDAQPDHIRQLVAGYAAGYGAAVREAGDAWELPAWCAGAEWIRPIDELDLYAYLGDVALMASGRNLAQVIGRAEAPGPDGPVEPSPMEALGGNTLASNGWAVGRDLTASGHGMVLANPHFPWYGEGRFWECHLTIPGTLDVYGVSLLGTPGVQMGFTEGVAWAHTFSAGHRFTLYQHDLPPGAPTTYRYGDDVREMTSRTHRIEVRGDDGATTALERTLWRTHHGPMVNLPLLGWGLETAFSYRDANLDNDAVLSQFLGMDQARDLDEFRAVYREVQGMPWVNTMAADRTGRVWYADASATPKLTDGAKERFVERVRTDLIAMLLLENRVALLDGGDPDDEWVEVEGVRSPGLEPVDALPQMERTDYVVNANDPHWMSHPAQPLEGFSPLCGIERQPLSLRTRQNLLTVGALAEQGGVTVDDLVDAVLGNRCLSADLLLDDAIGRCRAAGTVEVGGVAVDVAAAADVLAAWDRRVDLGSAGAALWRETVRSFPATDWRSAGGLFGDPFDPDDPVATPRRLADGAAGGPDPIVVAVATAVGHLGTAGVALDAPLGSVQWAVRGEDRVPVHGGLEAEGVLNILSPTSALASGLPVDSLEPLPAPPAPVPGRAGLAEGGYQVDYGTSFLMAVELTGDGPVGVGLLAYGQSGDPASPHHRDGTEAFAAKQLRPLLFRDADIDADPHLVRRTVRG
jgi:acyl-homoserine-lactone acylase